MAEPTAAPTPTATTFERVRPVRLYERVVEQIEAALARGEIKPGERLPSERELVVQFGASRSTIREALRVLESNGLVRSRPGDPHGPEVLPFSTGQLAKQMRRLVSAQPLGLAELIASRMILDSSANRLAARLHTPEGELAETEPAIEAMRAATDEGYQAFSEADFAFHEAIARASRNTLIQVSNQVVRDTVLGLISDKIAHARNAKALMRTSLAHHEEVLDAIRSRDGEAASRASKRSLYDYYAGYLPRMPRTA